MLLMFWQMVRPFTETTTHLQDNKIKFQQQNRANKMEGNLWVVDKISTCQQNHFVRVLLSQVLGIV